MRVKILTAYCGAGVECEKLFDYVEISDMDLKRKIRMCNEPLLVKVVGNSMLPVFHENDLLLFDEKVTQIDGSILLVNYNGELMIKRIGSSKPLVGLNQINNQNVGIVLYSYNHEYKPIAVSNFDVLVIIAKFNSVFQYFDGEIL